MAKYKGVKSEFQLRSLVFDDYFKGKDISYEEEINKIDFIVTDKKSRGDKNTGAKKHYIWMETKKKRHRNVYNADAITINNKNNL